MPVVKPIEEELEQVYLPRTEHEPNPEDRFWVVLDVSPAMGRDLVEVSSKDTAGTTLMKGVVSRMREWNYLQEDGTAWPITLENVGKLLDIEEINFLSDKIKTRKAPQRLCAKVISIRLESHLRGYTLLLLNPLVKRSPTTFHTASHTNPHSVIE